uniref:Secreted protein n=1 Tax=Meloidogyne incognita TaxID=6306 RepID=A0A914NA29_MELIC
MILLAIFVFNITQTARAIFFHLEITKLVVNRSFVGYDRINRWLNVNFTTHLQSKIIVTELLW